MSNSVWPHRRQPTRLPRPWDSPGKNTGVGCHCLLQCMKVKSEREVSQSCLTLSDSMDCSPPGSSIHGIFQARVLEWGAIAFSEEYVCCSINQNLALWGGGGEGAAEMKKLSLVWESDSGFSLISLMEIKSGLSPLTTCVNIMVESRMAYIVRTLINVWLYLYKP